MKSGWPGYIFIFILFPNTFMSAMVDLRQKKRHETTTAEDHRLFGRQGTSTRAWRKEKLIVRPTLSFKFCVLYLKEPNTCN
jgi:hypothetical protein